MEPNSQQSHLMATLLLFTLMLAEFHLAASASSMHRTFSQQTLWLVVVKAQVLVITLTMALFCSGLPGSHDRYVCQTSMVNTDVSNRVECAASWVSFPESDSSTHWAPASPSYLAAANFHEVILSLLRSLSFENTWKKQFYKGEYHSWQNTLLVKSYR